MKQNLKRGRERKTRQRAATVAQVVHLLKALIGARIAGLAREVGMELPPTIARDAAIEAPNAAPRPAISSRHFLQDVNAALDAIAMLKKLELDRPTARRRNRAQIEASVRAKLERFLKARKNPAAGVGQQANPPLA